MQSEPPHRQADVEYVVLEVLAHGRLMTTQEVIAAVKRKLDLAAADLVRANKRDNESKIDTIIANALQDGRQLCKARQIERVAKGQFRITGKGKEQLRELAEFTAMLDDLMPDAE